jgi:hypothetical protein
MPLTLPNPFAACRSFCDKPHNFQGLWITHLKLWITPLFWGPIFQKAFITAHIAKGIGTIKAMHKNKPIKVPIASAIILLLVFIFMFYFSKVFFFITYRLRRITATQFLYAFYFIS